MAGFREGRVGVLPPGALGVAFFYHLTAGLAHPGRDVVFLSRAGSASGAVLQEAGRLRVCGPGGAEVVELPLDGRLCGDLVSSYHGGGLPEVVLACPNPDQLPALLGELVDLLGALHEGGDLLGARPPGPALVLCANGIYFQRVRQLYVEKIEEAILLGALPDLWPEVMPRVVSRLLRGVTLQTGRREGSGAGAVYRPGPPGLTRLAGGGDATRERCRHLLGGLGLPVVDAAPQPPTRVELTKAIINLAANLLGMIHSIDDAGRFTPLTVGEILGGVHDGEVRELAAAVVEVGVAIRAYPPGAAGDLSPVLQLAADAAGEAAHHVPSSIQQVGAEIAAGTLRPAVPATEAWLLNPLIKYARAYDLAHLERYFVGLRERLLDRLARASAAAAGASRHLPPGG